MSAAVVAVVAVVAVAVVVAAEVDPVLFSACSMVDSARYLTRQATAPAFLAISVGNQPKSDRCVRSPCSPARGW